MGKLILEIAQEVLEENLHIEMGLGPPFEEDRKALLVAGTPAGTSEEC